MREITSHKVNPANDKISIQVLDEPGAGGASHVYQLTGFTPQEDAGKEAYTEYCKAVGGKSFRGEALPTWEVMKSGSETKRISSAWNIAAAAVPVRFQNGSIAEAGVNGWTQEALLSIVADRLESFQKGPYASKDNAEALHHVLEAKEWLFKRTRERMNRGVEGTMNK